MQTIDFLYMVVMFTLIAYWIGKVERKLDVLLSREQIPEEDSDEPKVLCPNCAGVNSIVPCEEVIDGINHKGLDTKHCFICGKTLITDSTMDSIDTIKYDVQGMRNLVLNHVKYTVLGCPNPTVPILQALNKLNRYPNVLAEYTNSTLVKAKLRDEDSLFTRVRAEIDSELMAGFPECFIEPKEEEAEH